MTRAAEVALVAGVLAVALPTVSACERRPLPPPAAAPTAPTAELRDDEMAQAIRHYFGEDRLLRGQNVQVEVTNAIANLGGSVTTLVARDRAGALAGTIRGIRAIVDRIGVDVPARSDDAIRSDVAQAQHDGLALQNRSVDIVVKSGTVTLTGTADSWQERSLIGDVTRAVPGVREVDNQIAVHSAMVRPEAEIAAEVKQRIDTDVWLDGATIAVTTRGQAVKLAGVVASVDQKVRAGTDAWVDGVDSVDDSGIVIDWRARDAQRLVTDFPLRSDAEVLRAVRCAFRYDPRVGSPPPTVSIDDGTAILSGSVASRAARMAAEEDAEDTIGVWGVRDEIRLTSNPPASDADIDREVRRALSEDVFLSGGASIRISAAKGRVILFGSVESGAERGDAVMDARSVPGVVEVDDQLAVKRRPEEIKSEIEHRLLWDAAIGRDRIDVEIAPDGVVTLSGTLDSWAEIRAARSDALQSGAKRVVTQLKLRGHPEFIVK